MKLSFRDSKVVFSVFEDDFKSDCEGNLTENSCWKALKKNDVESIVKSPANYEELCKLAIAYSDGVIQNSEKWTRMSRNSPVNRVPVLDYQPADTYVDAFNEFYDKVWEFEKK